MGASEGRLRGQVAIVTGASRGLGAAVAAAYALEGAAVAVAARTERADDERLPGSVHSVVDEITRRGGRSIAVRCDVCLDDDLVNLVDQVSARWGPVTTLVNNAALTVSGSSRLAAAPDALEQPAPSAMAMPVKGLRRHLEVNVLAAYRLVQLVAPGMISAGAGSIINVGSDAARRPGPGPYQDRAEAMLLGYGTSKAALQTMTQYLACDLAGYGIAVNALLPSAPLDTPGLRATSGSTLSTFPIDGFTEAAIRLATASPGTRTGQILYHQDVLEPDAAPRGWRGAP